MTSVRNYAFHSSAGQGAWIYIVDSGFDTGHDELQSTTARQVKTYVVPSEFGAPKLHLVMQNAGWEYGDTLIDDKHADLGHGTGVAGVAAGQIWGVAPKANLYLMKMSGYVINKTGAKERVMKFGGLRTALLHIFHKIADSAQNDPDMYACLATPSHENHPANSLFAATRRNA